MPAGAGVGQIGFRLSFSGLVRGFGCFGRMAWRWLIVVVCVIHWDQAVLWCCRGRRIGVGQCSCGLVPIPSCDLRFGPGTRLALSSHRRAITSSCRLIITPTLHLVVSQTSQPANRSARQPVSPPTSQPANQSGARQSHSAFRSQTPYSPHQSPHRSAHISHTSTLNSKNNLRILRCFLRWLTSRYRAVVHSNP